MREEFVSKWVVMLEDGRYLIYDDVEDIEEWDEVLEIRLPGSMAHMLQFTQHSYYTMQAYLGAQWEIMQKKLQMDGGEEGDSPIFDMVEQAMDGDSHTFEERFRAIMLHNDLTLGGGGLNGGTNGGETDDDQGC